MRNKRSFELIKENYIERKLASTRQPATLAKLLDLLNLNNPEQVNKLMERGVFDIRNDQMAAVIKSLSQVLSSELVQYYIKKLPLEMRKPFQDKLLDEESSILLLSLSLWVRSDSALWVYVENLTLNRYYWGCYMGMAAGSLMILISLLGCMGTLLESRLLIYTFVLLTAISTMFSVALLVLVWRVPGGDRLQNEIAQELKSHIDHIDYSDRSRDFLDLIQIKLQCCGAYTFVDYKNSMLPIPQSCSSDRTNNINYRSCSEMLRRYLEIRGGAMGGFALSLVLLQLILAILTLGFAYFVKSPRPVQL
ncbi:Tetraspanin-2A [Fragariocoptes setiger]|uniref:Tetraspanin-2A n=1 Tax=Fragariocoptes setiger TaxID=1670756 RepID=A0ABQ7SC86_9ACAR|nr:Tetraspanin-2A [Fragariocoptes setiger]